MSPEDASRLFGAILIGVSLGLALAGWTEWRRWRGR